MAGAALYWFTRPQPYERIRIQAAELDQPSYQIATAEVGTVTVEVLLRNLNSPYALEILPDGNALLSERRGQLRLIRDILSPAPQLDPQPIANMRVPDDIESNYGLQDVSLHPDFAENGLLYWTWNIPAADERNGGIGPAPQGHYSIMRGRLHDMALLDVETIFNAETTSYPGGSRLGFGSDGLLYATSGAPFSEDGADLSKAYGKVLRLHEDGSVPASNPFVGQDGALGAVFSFGHRDQLGLALSNDGQVFTVEHGANGGDELNLINPGSNYGWPAVSLSRNYDGSPLDATWQGEGIEDPLVAWMPSIAPMGMIIYSGEAFPQWQGNFLIASARRGQIEGTGGLERLVLNDELGELRRETMLTQLGQRFRDVIEGPDGLIYVLTDGPENALLRIAPSE